MDKMQLPPPPRKAPAMTTSPPPKKRAKTSHHQEDREESSSQDFRTGWLLASDQAQVEIIVQGVTFRVHEIVLRQHSEFFEGCLKPPFREAAERKIVFTDIEPQYMAYYLGVAYSYCSIVPHAIPEPPANPGAPPAQGPCLQDFIEVFKLCDRFISHDMRDFMKGCIYNHIGNGHVTLFRSSNELELQKIWMREFADGYEALDTDQYEQEKFASCIIKYFCEGIDYRSWEKGMDEIMDRTVFVAQVSKAFARKLHEAATTRGKRKRKELKYPRKETEN